MCTSCSFWSLCMMLSCILAPASASHNPLSLLPFLVAAKTSKFSSLKSLPPVAVDMQMDFEILATPKKPKQKIPKVKTVSTPKKLKKTKKSKKIAPKKSVLPPPPPDIAKTKTAAVVANNPKTKKSTPSSKTIAVKKKSSNTLSSKLESNLSVACNRIVRHKYATVVWASLLFVWGPLFIIFILNNLMGKEVFIEFLVNILPDNFPASWIEMAIEDGLWLGIFGLSILVAIGTFLVEMTTLVVDIAKVSSQHSKKTTPDKAKSSLN